MTAQLHSQTHVVKHIMLVCPHFEQYSPVYGTALHVALKQQDFSLAANLCKRAPQSARVRDSDGNLPLHILF